MLVVSIFVVCLIFALSLVVGIDIFISKTFKSTKEIDAEKRLVDISLDISDQISYYLLKYQISNDDFCKNLNISKTTLDTWLNGVYDFKLSQLTRIESFFKQHLIKTTLIERRNFKSY